MSPPIEVKATVSWTVTLSDEQPESRARGSAGSAQTVLPAAKGRGEWDAETLWLTIDITIDISVINHSYWSYKTIYRWFWVNYKDLTTTEPHKWWFVKGIIPKWPNNSG